MKEDVILIFVCICFAANPGIGDVFAIQAHPTCKHILSNSYRGGSNIFLQGSPTISRGGGSNIFLQGVPTISRGFQLFPGGGGGLSHSKGVGPPMTNDQHGIYYSTLQNKYTYPNQNTDF